MCITFLQHLRVTLVTVEVDKVLCQHRFALVISIGENQRPLLAVMMLLLYFSADNFACYKTGYNNWARWEYNLGIHYQIIYSDSLEWFLYLLRLENTEHNQKCCSL